MPATSNKKAPLIPPATVKAFVKQQAKSFVKKAPPKLSPQEQRVSGYLLAMRQASVLELYRVAKSILAATVKTPHRKQQQHVGVIIARINKKRRKFVIVPGGKAAPRTYRLTRRR